MCIRDSVIGAVFPIETVKEGIKNTFPMLGYDRNNALMAAEAIMTKMCIRDSSFPSEILIFT